MEQKSVKIVGLQVNNQVGIIKAHELKFDDKNRLHIFKGAVGEGKTTEQKIIQLGTQGSKTLKDDKKLYGDIDVETQILDGDVNIWIGCRSAEDGSLSYSLYTKDLEGKIVKNPVIDGIKATPSKYLETLQTELTWNMDSLTSANPTTQRDILLKLYQHEFMKLGVVFDKKAADYKDSILYLIEQAENDRNLKDAIRKQNGGIKEDLKLQGFDVERPGTIPAPVDVEKLREEKSQLQIKKATATQEAENKKELQLGELRQKGVELVSKAISYNGKLKSDYNIKYSYYEDELDDHSHFNEYVDTLKSTLEKLKKISGITDKGYTNISAALLGELIESPAPEAPAEPFYIELNDDETKITSENFDDFKDKAAKEIIREYCAVKASFQTTFNSEINVNTTQIDEQIAVIDTKISNATEINKIVEAVSSWHDWKTADDEVQLLKKKYRDLLTKVDTGVEGLKIVPEDDNIFLMYDGTWDTEYFNNPKKELRKVSSYSGTQKPVICLLIQNYLLNRKPKAMRYMYIDNIPIDNKTRTLLEKMCNELDLRIFLNITGDFTRDTLQDGEVLIEGGEIFFK